MRRLVVILVALAGLAAGTFWTLTAPGHVPASALGAHTPNLDNGRAMFLAGGCASCHATPGQEDRTRLGGGLELKSPFGSFFVPNISPHPADGIGGWSAADFATAMLKGTSPEGRHYYPAFPYGSYRRMPVGDVLDLFAYLNTLPAVAGGTRPHDLAFPYSIRAGVGVWKLFYLDGKPFSADAEKPADWNRGAYLVEGPGHCAECHSPRTALGGIVRELRLSGGPDPEGGTRWVPNITQHDKALRSWSPEDLVALLTTGDTPEFNRVGGQMAAVVRNTRDLSEADRRAMAVYLKSLPPVGGLPRPAAKSP